MHQLGQHLGDAQQDKRPVILLANCAVQPDAIMIELFNACTGLCAILCPEAFDNPSSCAESTHINRLCAVAVNHLHDFLHGRIAFCSGRRDARIAEGCVEEDRKGQWDTDFEEQRTCWSMRVTQHTKIHDVLKEGQ